MHATTPLADLYWRLAHHGEDFLGALLPVACLGCRALLSAPTHSPLRAYCRSCREHISLDGAATCVYANGLSVTVRAAALDAGPLAESMRALKFHGEVAAARGLGRLLASVADMADADLWTYVPSSPRRQRGRATEVTAALAYWAWFQLQSSATAPRAHRPRPAPLLQRVREAPPQRGLTIDERRDNVRDAFALRTDAVIRGARILLIDDVITTGATLRSAAEVLLRAGAAEVACATVLRHL